MMLECPAVKTIETFLIITNPKSSVMIFSQAHYHISRRCRIISGFMPIDAVILCLTIIVKQSAAVCTDPQIPIVRLEKTVDILVRKLFAGQVLFKLKDAFVVITDTALVCAHPKYVLIIMEQTLYGILCQRVIVSVTVFDIRDPSIFVKHCDSAVICSDPDVVLLILFHAGHSIVRETMVYICRSRIDHPVLTGNVKARNTKMGTDVVNPNVAI